MSAKDCPEYCNSEIPSLNVLNKERHRRIANFLEIDPMLDFQLGYVKHHATPEDDMERHMHSTSTEIVYILSGNQTYCIDGIDYRVGGGDILLSPPMLVHGGQKTKEEKGEFYYLNLNPDVLATILPQTDADDRQMLSQMLLSSPVQMHCADSRRLRELLESLLWHYDHDSSYQRLRIRNVLCDLLLFTADAMAEEQFEELLSPFMQEVYLYIEDHLTENLTLDALAAHFNYSKTAFRKKFKVYAHRTVHEYILHRKIEMAKVMLADRKADARKIWNALSFSSSSYFHQVFKRYTGMTVSQYRETIV